MCPPFGIRRSAHLETPIGPPATELGILGARLAIDGRSAVTPKLRIARIDDVRPTRWRNNGGWTRELVAWPRADDWIVRISVADIERDGPFSAYPGVERWFAVLDGDGVALTHGDAAAMTLHPGDPIYRFPGEIPTYCRLLGGATRDFNLMVRRDRATATVSPLPADAVATADWSGHFGVGLVSGSEQALAWTTGPARLAIDAVPDARGWRIDVVLANKVRR